jgi:hypothetical protein
VVRSVLFPLPLNYFLLKIENPDHKGANTVCKEFQIQTLNHPILSLIVARHNEEFTVFLFSGCHNLSVVSNHLASDIHVLTKLDAKYLNISKTREYLSLLKSQEWLWECAFVLSYNCEKLSKNFENLL